MGLGLQLAETPVSTQSLTVKLKQAAVAMSEMVCAKVGFLLRKSSVVDITPFINLLSPANARTGKPQSLESCSLVRCSLIPNSFYHFLPLLEKYFFVPVSVIGGR